ncbi:MAG: hypothetical protein R8G33_02670 [Gammaproteobacteria bacterium]|nr:hypothetical protein [Gammaproteobacteria bacterium]
MAILLILVITIGIRHALETDHMAAVLILSSQSNSTKATAKQGATNKLDDQLIDKYLKI